MWHRGKKARQKPFRESIFGNRFASRLSHVCFYKAIVTCWMIILCVLSVFIGDKKGTFRIAVAPQSRYRYGAIALPLRRNGRAITPWPQCRCAATARHCPADRTAIMPLATNDAMTVTSFLHHEIRYVACLVWHQFLKNQVEDAFGVQLVFGVILGDVLTEIYFFPTCFMAQSATFPTHFKPKSGAFPTVFRVFSAAFPTFMRCKDNKNMSNIRLVPQKVVTFGLAEIPFPF